MYRQCCFKVNSDVRDLSILSNTIYFLINKYEIYSKKN